MLVVSLCAAVAAGPAGAERGPIEIASVGSLEQADEASAPALSADGRYVAFQGALGGLRGVFRKRLPDGPVELVAGRDQYSGVASFQAPSISADGRYVSFTSTAALDPAADAGADSDVYVRDMGLPAPPGGEPCAAAPCAYRLASALDGEIAGLTHAGNGGSVAAGRVALSADGRRVAFVTAVASNLATGPGGAITTPARQVAVRDLDALRTTLVSVERDPVTGAMTGEPVDLAGAAAPGAVRPTTELGAALSADGSTVAWLGANVSAQVPMLADEARPDGLGLVQGWERSSVLNYSEPLWRRIADGPEAPTRRIVGGGDPLAPGCPPSGTLATAACQGPFPRIVDRIERESGTGWLQVNSLLGTPQLSADGRTVALIGTPAIGSDVFVVDMRQGLTRAQALRPLTRHTPLPSDGHPNRANEPGFVAGSGDVFDVAISSDGQRVAFVTARSLFPLAPPNLIGPPLAQIGVRELYAIDLAHDALERVTGDAVSGGPSRSGSSDMGGPGAAAPSFTTDGRMLSFASQAFNLVPGDANGASDVFTVSELATAEDAATVDISPPPPGLKFTPRWRMAARAIARPDGRVRLEAVVPGAGVLRVAGSGPVKVRAKRAARKRRGVRPTRLAVRQVVSASRRVSAEGRVAVTLRPVRRYRAATRTRAGLEATLRIAFSARGRAVLRDELDVRFRVKPRKAPRRVGGAKRKTDGTP